MEDLTGKRLGKYQVAEQLGEGGMATVYKAYQPNMERYVALKILPVHDFGEADGYTYLVMRYVEGQTLGSLLQGEPLPPSRIRNLISQIAAALDYAHSRGVVHRDIKPNNVLLDEQGNCLLSDFGLAKVLISSAHLTASGAFLGTPKYASPEQCLGSSEIDQRSDVYSLGVILYEMVTGRVPFDADTPMGVVIKHIHDPLPLPSTINPDMPEAVERVILKALSKDVDGRYSTAGELAQAYYVAVDVSAKDRGSLPVGVARSVGETTPAPAPVPEKGTPTKNWIWPVAVGLMVAIGVILAILAAVIINAINDDIAAARPPAHTNNVAVLPDTEVPEPEELAAYTGAESQIEPPTYTPLPTYTALPTYTPLLPTKANNPTNTPIPRTTTPRPTNTPRLEKPYVIADKTYFCRQEPNTSSEQHWMFSEGSKNMILGKSGNWWLIAVDDSSTRTNCCWVGGGDSGGDLSVVPIINYEIDRTNCPPFP